MSPKTWRRVKHIVYDALEKAPKDWQEYLRNSCHADDEVLDEARSLLEASREAEDFIEVPVRKFLL